MVIYISCVIANPPRPSTKREADMRKLDERKKHIIRQLGETTLQFQEQMNLAIADANQLKASGATHRPPSLFSFAVTTAQIHLPLPSSSPVPPSPHPQAMFEGEINKTFEENRSFLIQKAQLSDSIKREADKMQTNLRYE